MEAEAPPAVPADDDVVALVAASVEARGRGVREARAPFRELLLVCAKCARKLDGRGFGKKGRKPLRAELKKALKSGCWGPKVRVVDAACLGLCPKGRQVIATPEGLARRRLTVLSPGAEAAAALDQVLSPSSSQS